MRWPARPTRTYSESARAHSRQDLRRFAFVTHEPRGLLANDRPFAHVSVVDAHVVRARCERRMGELRGASDVARKRALWESARADRRAAEPSAKVRPRRAALARRAPAHRRARAGVPNARRRCLWGALGLQRRLRRQSSSRERASPNSSREGVGLRDESLDRRGSDPPHHRDERGSEGARQRGGAPASRDGCPSRPGVSR